MGPPSPTTNIHRHDHDEEAQRLLMPLEQDHPTSLTGPAQFYEKYSLQIAFAGFSIVVMGIALFQPWLAFLTVVVFLYHVRRTAERAGSHPTRIKSVVFHDEKPWILMASSSGHVILRKEEDETTIHKFHVSSMPVRAAQFITNEDWILTASDDSRIRIHTPEGEKLQDFLAHEDFIRSLAVHPTQPSLFWSSADDATIKLWEVLEPNNDCRHVRTYQGHAHYVMMVKPCPSDAPYSFATASLDRTIKFWKWDHGIPQLTLDGHEEGVNAIDFCGPLLASASDDHKVLVWNYQSRQLLQKLEGHTHNVSAVVFFRQQPNLLVSTSEDGTLRFWKRDAADGCLQFQSLPPRHYRDTKGRGWALATNGRNHQLAVGFDEACVCLELNIDNNHNEVKINQEYDCSSISGEEDR